ncbi:MAG: AAA family ATPase [Candidatus Heimdallarchaeota archaeon]|nr:MAG: AAA family ATPase [Candidatus Heimdallarchaeota archaeon]
MKRSNFNLVKFLNQQQNIIKDEHVFEPTYLPECLVHREEELSLLANHFKSVLSKSNSNSGKHIIIQGPVGLGKTVVAKKFGMTFEEFSRTNEDVSKISYFHINCRRQRSWYLILTSILRRLVPAFPIRGFGVDELLTFLANIVNEREHGLLICLDEIDYLLTERSDHDVLYSLIRHHEGILHLKQVPISLILITRNPHFQTLLDTALLSSLCNSVIVFSPYNNGQMFDILSLRVQKGLHENTCSDDLIKSITSLTINNGDARTAIELLWRSAKVAEQEKSPRINFEHIRRAKSSLFPIKRSVITDLSQQQKYILQALALLLKNETSCGFVTTKELQEKYCEICTEAQILPRKQTQFWNYLQELAKHGIVELEVRNRHHNGKSAGRTTMISISDIPISELLPLLE